MSGLLTVAEIKQLLPDPLPFKIKVYRLAKVTETNIGNIRTTGVAFCQSPRDCILVNQAILINIVERKWNSINTAFRRGGFERVKMQSPTTELFRIAPFMIGSARKWKKLRYSRGSFSAATTEAELSPNTAPVQEVSVVPNPEPLPTEQSGGIFTPVNNSSDTDFTEMEVWEELDLEEDL
jgi:hypothetical protein